MRGISVLILGIVLCGLAACSDGDDSGTPATSASTSQSGSSTVSDCPAPGGSAKPVTAPLPYSQTLRVAGGYEVTFSSMDSTSDSSSQVTLTVRRKSSDCNDETSVQLSQGGSTEALGLRLTIERVMPSTGGRPPSLTIKYSH
jgi:hypothetical protein